MLVIFEVQSHASYVTIVQDAKRNERACENLISTIKAQLEIEDNIFGSTSLDSFLSISQIIDTLYYHNCTGCICNHSR